MKKAEKKGKKQEGGTFLSSLKLTIALLILLAALSVIGTVITQNATEAEYLQRYSEETYYIFKGLGLLDMYHSWWFIGVLILLAINLIACSVKRLPGVWRHVREAKSGYARLGTYLTHLSVLLILVGGLIGAVWGAKGYVEIPEGETMKGVLLRKFQWMMQPLRFEVRCDAFRVDFYPDGSPKEYVSTLTFFEGGRVVLDHTPLRVNHPISYKGLTFYQAKYGISARSIVEVRGRNPKSAPYTLELSQGEVVPIPDSQVHIGFMQYREHVHDVGEVGEAILLVLFVPDAHHQPSP